MSFSWKSVAEKAIRFSKAWKGVAYEKGESQTFYNEFFELFGIKRRSVARFEEHVRKINNSSGFIDLLWPKVLIVEHKSLGADLESAAEQAGAYFDALPEDLKPRYQLVCDFQSFSLLDRDTREIVEFDLSDLHKQVRHFSFMVGRQPPKNRESKHLNVEAAGHIANIHRALNASGYPVKDQEAFLAQLVFCLFADNTGIFQPRGIFVDLVDFRAESDGSNLGPLLAQLFQVLDTPVSVRQSNLDKDLAEFPYIDGGLFGDRISIPTLDVNVYEHLLSACMFDWSEVSPAIFGSLFQSVLTPTECRDIGAYSTSEDNILKVLSDLFLDSLRAEFEELRLPRAHRLERLFNFRKKLATLKFFDPACGCGNFLVVAYRELRRLELGVLVELDRLGGLQDESKRCSIVDVNQFYGIEVRSYSARIATTAMWMMDHIANNDLSLSLNVDYYRLPLKKKPDIMIGDALELDWESVVTRDECFVLFGNPPYKGPKQQSEKERIQVREIAALGGAGGTLDYVCGWIIRAAHYANKGVRVGLVAIHSVVHGEQAGQLWPLLFDKYSLEIEFAHQPFQWFNEAKSKRAQVQVVILGLVSRSFVNRRKNLYQYSIGCLSPSLIECDKISPYLVVGDSLINSQTTIKSAPRPENGLPVIKTGTKPIDGGYYILNDIEVQNLVAIEPGAKKYIRPFMGTDEFLYNRRRFLLVLNDASAKDLRGLPNICDLISKVEKFRKGEIKSKDGRRRLNKKNDLYKYPTKFHLNVLPKEPFLVIPEVTSERRKYVPIGWVEPPVVPSNLVKVCEQATLEQFALLMSAMHMAWLQGIGGHLEARNRYSIKIVYNCFPVPSKVDYPKLQQLAKDVLHARDLELDNGGNLSDIYDDRVMPSGLRKAHEALDNEVDKLYLGRVAVDKYDRVLNLINRYSASH